MSREQAAEYDFKVILAKTKKKITEIRPAAGDTNKVQARKLTTIMTTHYGGLCNPTCSVTSSPASALPTHPCPVTCFLNGPLLLQRKTCQNVPSSEELVALPEAIQGCIASEDPRKVFRHDHHLGRNLLLLCSFALFK